MPSFKLYTGNKLELLLDALAEVVSVPHESALTPEIIVVQNTGMQRWISLQLARKLGIWANCSFLFPNAFIETLFKKALPDYDDNVWFEPRTLTWRIMKLLPTLLERPEFDQLNTYLHDGRQLKLFQLASKIADTFDNYTLYRPALIMQWEQGKESHWQAVLWRALAAEGHGMHRARMKSQVLLQMAQSSFLWPGPARRFSLFGISSLPPFHVEMVRALSSFVDVHVFLLNPCAEYWDDVLSEREIGNILKKKGKPLIARDDMHWEKGNRLLSSLGGYVRDFLWMLHDMEGEEFSLVEAPPERSMLSCIQSDILHLRERGEGQDVPAIPLSASDDSIQIHSCHGPLREMETLYDILLKQFEKLPELLPSDIVVMTPDIELYAPFIHAVFGAPENERLRIPYSVTDCGAASESPLINALFSLFDTTLGRCTAAEVLSLLEMRPFQEAFCLVESDVELIRSWVKDTRIRWGLDEEARATFDVPVFPENTWKSGIESMLLGYAMAGNNRETFDNIVPFEAIEGSQAEVLAHFLDFIEKLGDLRATLLQTRPLKDWSRVVSECIDGFFVDSEDNSRDLAVLRSAAHELEEAHSAAPVELAFEVIRKYLEQALKKTSSASGFLAGAVTFCAMLPMRGIPFRIVCLAGMNDDVFPRASRFPAWDLISGHPQKGDRSLEKEDRYIFLEALLSARDMVCISYAGQDIKDNSSRLPSVAVSELLDYLDRAFVFPGPGKDGGHSLSAQGRGRVSDHITIRHRLQAFSPRYFVPGGLLFSYSEENYHAACNAARHEKTRKPFFSAPLAAPSSDWREISVADLCAFFVQPIRFLLQKRLGMRLREVEQPLEEKEPFFIEGLEGYRIGQQLVERLLDHESRQSCFQSMKAASLLPHGAVGACAFDMAADEASAFVDRIESIIDNKELFSIDVHAQAGEFTVAGRIDNCTPSGLVLYRFANARPIDMLHFWIKSLVCAALSAGSYKEKSVLLARDGCWELPQIPNASRLLESLLDLYWQGLSFPLHFFSKSSWTYAQSALVKNKSPDAALREARAVWTGDEYVPGESEDPYYALCFAAAANDPLNDDFEKRSIEVFGPLLKLLTAAP